MAIDQDQTDDFMGKLVADFGTAFNAGMGVIGEKPGPYKTLVKYPWNLSKLATATDQRHVRQRLCSQTAGGYVNDTRWRAPSVCPQRARSHWWRRATALK